MRQENELLKEQLKDQDERLKRLEAQSDKKEATKRNLVDGDAMVELYPNSNIKISQYQKSKLRKCNLKSYLNKVFPWFVKVEDIYR